MLGRNNDILLHVLSKEEVIFLNSVYEVIIVLVLKPDIVSTEKMQTLSLMHTNKIFYKPIIFLIIKKSDKPKLKNILPNISKLSTNTPQNCHQNQKKY